MFLTVLLIVLVFLSIILHEVAHGYAALWCGDQTAKQQDRLTLNPIRHIDPIGTVVLPLVMYFTTGWVFGWAKPVPVNPYNFSRPRVGIFSVGLAGPMANIIFAFVIGLLLRFIALNPLLSATLYKVALINLVLAVFNLIPIPPLDGSKVLMSLLPRKYAQKFHKLEPYGFILVFALVYLGAFRWIILPAVSILAWLLGLPV